MTTDEDAGAVSDLSALRRATAALSEADDIPELFRRVAEEVGEVVPYHTLRLFLLDPDTDELVPVAIASDVEDGLEDLDDPRLRLRVGQGVTGHIAETRRSEIVYDLESHPNAFHIPGTPDIEESFVGVPLLFRDELVGVLTLTRFGLDQFDESSLAVVEVLAVSIAAAIGHRRAITAEKRARDREVRLQQLHSAFVANIGHELRTPMATASGFLELVRSHVNGDDTLGDFLDGAQKGVEDLRDLIEKLLSFVSIEAGHERLKLERCRIADLLDTARSAADLAGARVQITGDLDAVVVVDARRVGEVLAELFDNALEFGPPGGSVHVHVERDSGVVHFEVSDDGEGIPEEDLEFIFERFTQRDPSLTREHTGAGLGLALARSIARWHGGELTAAAGSPTTFRLTIPEIQSGRTLAV